MNDTTQNLLPSPGPCHNRAAGRAEVEKNGNPSLSPSLLAGTPEKGNFQVAREDWTLLRSVGTLGQRSGVSPEKLRRLIVNELVDIAGRLLEGGA